MNTNLLISKIQIIQDLETLYGKLVLAMKSNNTGLIDCYTNQIRNLEGKLKEKTCVLN